MSKEPKEVSAAQLADDAIRISRMYDLKSMQDELDQVVASTSEKYHVRIASLERQLLEQKKLAAEQEELRNAEREEIVANWRKREKELESRLKETERRAVIRESDLIERKKSIDVHLNEQRAALQKEIDNVTASKLHLEAERERLAQENQEKLRANSAIFVDATVKELDKKESSLSRVSFWWSVVGGALLMSSVVAMAIISYTSIIKVSSEMNWPLLTFYALKGSVLIAVAGVASRYSYILSSNYMREALRTSDRIHAIKFGQLYVETYGAAADWEQVKEAFSNWNGENTADWRDDHSESRITPSSNLDTLDKIKNLIG